MSRGSSTGSAAAADAVAHVPDDAVPDDAVPDDAVPDDAVPDGSAPDDAVPDDAVPGDAEEAVTVDEGIVGLVAEVEAVAEVIADVETVTARDTDIPLDRAEVRRLDRAESKGLLIRLAQLDPDDPDRVAVRERLVRLHMPLVEHLARRFRNRGEPLDDLVQVATIGLIKSVDRYDPERGVEFSTYATPTIVGEVKRHFRDKGWAVRVPRRLQELRLQLTGATAALSQDLGRAPTVAELARYLSISDDEVLEGLESANAYSTLSLDAPDSGDEDRPAVADTLGEIDDSLEGVEYRESLKPLLAQLPEREKKILLLRFFGGMTQSQIAEQVGISQMHVSRLLARTLAQLREGLLAEG